MNKKFNRTLEKEIKAEQTFHMYEKDEKQARYSTLVRQSVKRGYEKIIIHTQRSEVLDCYT